MCQQELPVRERPYDTSSRSLRQINQKCDLAPMQVHKTVGVAKIPVLSKRLNMMTEPLPAREAIEGIEAISSYETFKQGGNRATIRLQNGTQEKITLKNGTKVTHVTAANNVPPMLAPDPSIDKSELEYMTQKHNNEGVLEYKQ